MNEQWNSLPEEDRPYEKCERYGVQALTNRELLAVILRTGARGRSVLELAGELLNDSAGRKKGFTGIRRMSLGRAFLSQRNRKSQGDPAEMRTGDRAPDGEGRSGRRHFFSELRMKWRIIIWRDLRHEEQEVLLLLMLNQKGRLLKEKYVFRGTVNASIVSPP